MKERKNLWKGILATILAVSMIVGIMPVPKRIATVNAATSLPVFYETEEFDTRGRNTYEKTGTYFKVTATNPYDEGFYIGIGAYSQQAMTGTVTSLQGLKIEKLDVILWDDDDRYYKPPKVNGMAGVREESSTSYHAKYTFSDLNTTSAKICTDPSGNSYPNVEKVIVYYKPISVSLQSTSLSLTAGGSASSISAAVSPSTFSNQKIKWSVTSGTDKIKLYSDSDCTVPASPSEGTTGLVYVKGLKIGSATIKAECDADSTKYATCNVTVNGTKRPTPSGIGIIGKGYQTFAMTGLKADMKVMVGLAGQSWVTPTLDESGEYNVYIPHSVPMNNIFKIDIKNVGDGITTTDSDYLTIRATHAEIPVFNVTQPSTFTGKGKVNTVSGIHEYSTAEDQDVNSEGTWHDCTTDMEFDQGSVVIIRTKASGSTLASGWRLIEINTFEGTKEATPSAEFEASGYNTGTLKNVSSGMKYSINGGNDWVNITGTTQAISSVTPDNGIKVFMPGNNTTTLDSDVQTINVTRGAIPSPAVTQPATIPGKGSIATTTDHEYSTDGTNWTACSGALNNLEQGSIYYIRTKASGASLASESNTITINSFEGEPEVQPNASFTAGGTDSGELSDLTANGVYIISGAGLSSQEITANASGKYAIASGLTTGTLSVIKKGDGVYTTNSSAQSIIISRGAIPSPAVTQPTTIPGKGSIATTTDHEYSTDGTNWTACSGTLSNLDQESTYYIRTKASGTYLTSDTKTITINKFVGEPENQPNASFTAGGTDSGELSDLTASGVYIISGAGLSSQEITANASGKYTLASGLTAGTLSVVKKGDGVYTTNSQAQTITVSRGTVPNPTVTQPTTIPGKGSIATTTDHEYSTDGTTWTACSGALNNLAQGSTYYIRTKASGTYLTSETKTITINNFEGEPEDQPEASFEANGTDSGELSNLTAENIYIISGAGLSSQEITADEEGKYTFESGLTEGTISLVKTGDGEYTTDSPAQTIEITRGAVPNLAVTQPTTVSEKGSVATTTDHEYSTDGTTWTSCDGALNDLAQGSTCYIRVKANGTALASGNQTVKINTVTPEVKKETPPVATVTPTPSVATVTPTPSVAAEKEEINKTLLYEGLKINQNKSRIRIQWTKSEEADGYDVYVCYCGKELAKPIKTIKNKNKTSVDVKKLDGKKINLKRSFKTYVVAYKMVDGKKVSFAKTVTAHVAGINSSKCSNVKKIKLSKKNITINVGKTDKISAKLILSGKGKKQLGDNHDTEFRYASTNSNIASVDSNGKVKGVSQGSCYIYVYAINGLAKKVKVTVK